MSRFMLPILLLAILCAQQVLPSENVEEDGSAPGKEDRVSAEHALERLATIVRNPERFQRIELFNALSLPSTLSDSQRERAADLVLMVLKIPRNTFVRSKAVMMLGGLGVAPDGAVEVLEGLRSDRNPDVRYQSMTALANLTEQVEEYGKILIDEIIADRSGTAEANSAYAMLGTAGPKLSPRDKQVERATGALMFIWRGRDRLVPHVAKHLSIPSEAIRIRLLRVLRFWSPESDVAWREVATCLGDDSPVVRILAVQTLGRLTEKNGDVKVLLATYAKTHDHAAGKLAARFLAGEKEPGPSAEAKRRSLRAKIERLRRKLATSSEPADGALGEEVEKITKELEKHKK